MIINVYLSSRKVPDIFVRLWWNLDILDIFWKNIQIINFVKIRPVGTELFQADGRTDRYRQLTVAFRNSANTPSNNSRRPTSLISIYSLA
jgi:hypothetical protein